MGALRNERCTACRRDSPQVTVEEVEELKLQVPEWKLLEKESILWLERIFRFSNFAEALSFTNRVGGLAEAEGHHPRDSDRTGPGDGDALDACDTRASPERLYYGGEGRLSGGCALDSWALCFGSRLSGLPIASRKMAFLCFACGEKKSTTSSSKKVKPVAPRRWA